MKMQPAQEWDTETMEPQASERARPNRGPSLLRESRVKNFIRETAARVRPGSPFERVSDEALEMLEYWLRQKIIGAIRVHRHSKTFKDVM